MTRLVPLSEFLDSTDLPAEIVQLWEGSFHFVETGVNFRLEHQSERRAREPQMSSQPKTENYADRAASEPTDLHREFAAWIEEKTGQKVDLKSIQLACTLRMDFQASEENQTSLAARKKAAEAKRKADAVAKKAKLEAQLAKLQAELAKETATSKPAETAAPAAKKTAPSKAATPKPAESAKAAEAPATPAKRAPRTRRTATPKTATPASK